MKKIKLLTPIVALTGLSAAIAPMVTLSSCNKNNTNKVYLAKGQTAEKTVSTLVDKVTYKFKQENLVSPEYTKVSIADFAINGVAHSLWARTFMYRADSAGNISLSVDTGAIKNSMSGTVNEISFNLVFKNKKANTVHYVGPFKITFDASQIALVDTSALETKGLSPEIKHLSTSFDAAKSDPFTLKVTLPASTYLKGITLKTATSGKELKPGTDYSIVPLASTTGNVDASECLIVAVNNTEDLVISDIQTTTADPAFVPGLFLNTPTKEDRQIDRSSSEKDYIKGRVFTQEGDQANAADRWVDFIPKWAGPKPRTWSIDEETGFSIYDINEKKTTKLSSSKQTAGYYQLMGLTKDEGQYIVTVPLTTGSAKNDETETTQFSFVMETFTGTTEKAEEEGEEEKKAGSEDTPAAPVKDDDDKGIPLEEPEEDEYSEEA